MPGGIATRLQRHIDPEELERARREAGAGAELKTIEQGAATSIVAAISPLLDGIGGRYLEDCHEADTIPSRADSDGRHGVAAYALDPANAERVWDLSEHRRVPGLSMCCPGLGLRSRDWDSSFLGERGVSRPS